MFNHKHGELEVCSNLIDECGKIVGLLRVHASGRFVEQEQAWFRGECACYFQTALSAVRKRSALFVTHIVEAKYVQKVCGFFALTFLFLVVEAECCAQDVAGAAAVFGNEYVVEYGLRLPQANVLERARNA